MPPQQHLCNGLTRHADITFYTGMKWPACRGVRFGARMDSPARTACRLRRPVRPMLALDRQTSGQRDGQRDTSLQHSLRADARYIVSFICDHPIVGRITRYTPSVRSSVVCPSLPVVNSKKIYRWRTKWRYVYSFRQNTRTWQTDGRMTPLSRACISPY